MMTGSELTVTAQTSVSSGCHTDDLAPVTIWRGNTDDLTTQTGDQRQAHEHVFEQLSTVRDGISEVAQQSPDASAARNLSAGINNGEIPVATGCRQTTAVNNTDWWRWTAALLGTSATLGALETFSGRLAQEGVRVLSGHPQQTQDVSDRLMAAHAAVNVATALVAGVRAGLHTYRAMGNPAVYGHGLRGERSAASSMTLALAGTPDVPASRLTQLSSSMGVALATFLATSHTGLVALTQIGSTSDYKVDAYKAVVKSNGNSAYCYVREGINLCSRALGLLSHDAMVTPRGIVASSAQYLVNSVGQEMARSSMGLQQGENIDLLWPSISAAAEFADVGFIAGSARFAEPERPVALLGGRLSERTDSEQPPQSTPTLPQALDRLTQRAVGRQLVAELTRVVPYEAGAVLRPYFGSSVDTVSSWSATLLAAGTHLREPMWQAERACQTFRR